MRETLLECNWCCWIRHRERYHDVLDCSQENISSLDSGPFNYPVLFSNNLLEKCGKG